MAVLLTSLCLLIPTVAVVANEDVYADDPLGLIAGYNVTTHYSLDRDDLWDVWICDVPEGTLEFSPEETVSMLEEQVAPYFDWLSGGLYRPVFRVGGLIKASSFDNWSGCNYPVYNASGNLPEEERPEGVLIIVNKATTAHFGSIGGYYFPSPVDVSLGQDTTYPNNARSVYAGGQSLAEPGSLPPTNFVLGHLPKVDIIAHEMGHGIGFPHSSRGGPYDNPMDIMSKHDHLASLQLGTIAINRYAAGWIDPSQVRIHNGGKAVYELHPIGSEGTQMLVLQSDGSAYMTLGVRVRKGYDVGIAHEGVESYLIDQQPTDCFQYPRYQACWGTERPTMLYADVDEDYTWEGINVNIVRRIGDRFLVEVSVSTLIEDTSNTFVDDDGSTHEENIEIIAALDITVGCDTQNRLYCPSQPVKRSEMAAFLGRALDERGDGMPTVSRFSDVPEGAWYLGYVESLAELGVFLEEAGSAFRPSDPLTRLEMAVWMVGAFESISEVEPQGAFSDVPAGEWYAAAVEGLLAAEVTNGCKVDPLAFCPHDPVRRDEMASFLARALIQ
ncbi:MAG: S-layer homology domain-containing protein [bacterium]|nr:S-layer homology domain-containing protein [bacterium]